MRKSGLHFLCLIHFHPDHITMKIQAQAKVDTCFSTISATVSRGDADRDTISQTTGSHLYFILCKHFNDYFLEHTHLKISVYLKLQLELNKCL